VQRSGFVSPKEANHRYSDEVDSRFSGHSWARSFCLPDVSEYANNTIRAAEGKDPQKEEKEISSQYYVEEIPSRL